MPYESKEVRGVLRLLKPNGRIRCTVTYYSVRQRKEMVEFWQQKYGSPSEPVTVQIRPHIFKKYDP